MLASEVLIGLLWILGALNYVRLGGQQAGILLLAAVLLLGTRIAVACLHLARPSPTMHPRIWVLLLGLFLPEHLTSAGTIIAPHYVPLQLAFISFIGETITRPLAALSA